MLVASLAVLALILYACSDSGSPKKPTAGGPVASGTATTTASVGAAAAGGASGTTGASGSTGASSPAGATGGTTAGGTTTGGTTAGGTTTGGTTAGGTTTGGTTTGGTTTAGTTTGGTAPAGACQLTLTLTSRAAAYANGEKPDFSVAVVNRGTADCTADLGPKSLVLTVFSGPDRIWSSADCGGTQDLRAIPPGGVLQIPFTWSRIRSQAGCSGPATDAALGTYNASATLATGTGPTAAAFTSQPQSFQLKTGS